MKLNEVIHRVLASRITIYCAVATLVVSLGLLCDERARRRSGGAAPGVGLKIEGCAFQISSARSANFLAAWGLSSTERNGFFVGARGYHADYNPGLCYNRRGLYLSVLGFAFDFVPTSFQDYDVIIGPHLGLAVPLWFTSAASLGALLYGRYLRHRSVKLPLGGSASKRFAYKGVENWLVTCSLWFAAAELLWCCAQYVKRFDVLEIPMTILLCPALLIDLEEGTIQRGGMFLYAAAFWASLFFASLVLSRKRINPAIPAAAILGLMLLAAFLIVTVAA